MLVLVLPALFEERLRKAISLKGFQDFLPKCDMCSTQKIFFSFFILWHFWGSFLLYDAVCYFVFYLFHCLIKVFPCYIYVFRCYFLTSFHPIRDIQTCPQKLHCISFRSNGYRTNWRRDWGILRTSAWNILLKISKILKGIRETLHLCNIKQNIQSRST